MEVLIVIPLLLVAVLIALATWAGSTNSRTELWNRAFGQVAQRFHGRFSRGGWFSEPVLDLLYGSAQARVTTFALGRGGRRCVQLVIQQSDVRTRVELASRPATTTLVADTRGLAEVEIDWAGQYQRWRLLAGNPDEARHLFTQGVRLALDRLWLHPLPADTAVTLIPGWMVVRRMWDAPRGADLELFVESACTLHDQIGVALVAGIEFVAGDQAQLLDEATCSVCCDKLGEDVVFCGRCQTPCHRDCWEYSGGCATFGCGGKQCFVPREAPLAGPHFGGAIERTAWPAKPR